MNVFGIGLPEMALILVLALLVFGPKKLPEIGRSLGKAIKGFQDASKEFEEEFKKEAQQLEKTIASPMKASLETDPPKALSPQETGAPVETIVASTSEPESVSTEDSPVASSEAASEQGEAAPTPEPAVETSNLQGSESDSVA
jgi:sec-independent protein translocase protein TatA